jgi:hypothetical protein
MGIQKGNKLKRVQRERERERERERGLATVEIDDAGDDESRAGLVGKFGMAKEQLQNSSPKLAGM